MKFNFEKPTQTQKPSQTERSPNNQEKEKSMQGKFMERIRNSVKPIFAYGLYALALTSPENTVSGETVGDNKTLTIEQVHQKPKIEGEGSYNYYHKSQIEPLDNFRKIYESDEGFRSDTHPEKRDLEYQVKEIVEDQRYNYASRKIHVFGNMENGDTFANNIIEFAAKDKESALSLFYETDVLEAEAFLKNNCNLKLTVENLLGNSEYHRLLDKRIEDLRCEIEDITPETELLYTHDRIIKRISDIEQSKEGILNRIRSEAYLERLAKETGGDVDEAKKIQEERASHLLSRDYYLSNSNTSSSEDASGHMQPHADHDKNYVVFNNDVSSQTATHEFSHLADEGGKNIPEKTIQILKDKFSLENLAEYQKEKIEYYSKHTELLARKSVLDDQLETLGIKKYSEEFTEKHYAKIKKLMEEGSLDNNAEEFFRSFEEESLIMIMNNIATNEIDMRDLPGTQSKLIENYIDKISGENNQTKMS